MLRRISLLLALAIAAGLAQVDAQTTGGKRAIVDANTGGSSAANRDFAWDIAAPNDSGLPTLPNRTPPSRLMYSAWGQINPMTTNLEVYCRTSTDGGLTWETPVLVYTGAANEVAEEVEIAATGNHVFLFVQREDPTSAGDEFVYAHASADEGRTWSPPTLLSTAAAAGLLDCDRLEATGSGGNGIVVWEMENPGSEDCHYAVVSADVNGNLVVRVPDTRLDTASTPGAFDVDEPNVCSDGNKVMITYMDNVNGGNQVFYALSTDAGLTFSTPASISAGGSGSDMTLSDACCISGDNLFVVHHIDDVPNSISVDTPVLAYSNDAGQTWRTDLVVSDVALPNTSVDSDAVRVYCDGNTVVITWHDDRLGDGNNGNRAFLTVDPTGGGGFITGPLTNQPLDFGFPPSTMRVRTENAVAAVSGDSISVYMEISRYQGGAQLDEDVVCATSCDGGVTWPSRLDYVTQGGSLFSGSLDIDNPKVAKSSGGITGGLDVGIGFQWNASGVNEYYTAGQRNPTLQYLGAGAGGMLVTNIPATFNGDTVVIAVTEVPWANGSTPGFVFDPVGTSPNFVLGSISFGIYLGFGGLYTAPAQNCQASFPNVLKVPQGVSVEAVAIGFGPGGRIWYSDPVTYVDP